MENAQEEKGLVLAKEQHEGVVAIFDPNKTQFWCSMGRDSMEDKILIMNAMNNPTYKVADVAEKKVLMAKHILAHRVQMVTDDGEILDADRVVIIMENGETVAGVSKGFKAGVTNLMNVFGQPPYTPAMPLLVSRVTTRRSFNTFNLSVVVDSPLPVIGAVETKKGGKQ